MGDGDARADATAADIVEEENRAAVLRTNVSRPPRPGG